MSKIIRAKKRGVFAMNIADQIKAYNPCNRQEEMDKIEILRQMQSQKDIFSRDNKAAHMTASAWVVNHERSKVLMVYHNIYNSWSWMGGHADGDADLYSVAFREVQEESGLKHINPITNEIFSLEILTVDGHEKNGEYISSHLHLNVTYLFEADEKAELYIKPDENNGVAWFDLEEAIEASTEPWFQERIYRKLNEKLRDLLRGNGSKNRR